MPLPRAIALLNKRFTNRFIEPIVSRSADFARVHHVGRRTGHHRTTPVKIFFLDGDGIVALTYGPSADWVRNVVASGGSVEHQEAMKQIASVEVVGRAVAWPALPKPIRFALRVLTVHDFLRIDIEAGDRTPPD